MEIKVENVNEKKGTCEVFNCLFLLLFHSYDKRVKLSKADDRCHTLLISIVFTGGQIFPYANPGRRRMIFSPFLRLGCPGQKK
jgi:hypothetical protein